MSSQPKSKDIHWHSGRLNEGDRGKFLEQKGCVVWFTGLSASGKSTVAREVEMVLVQEGIHATALDGDNVRHGLNRDLGFSPEDRTENIRRIGEVANLFAVSNVICLTAFISPYKADREQVRALVPDGLFIEVFCDTSLEKCEERDPKGLYKKARAGEIPEFTGISAPYEPPENPEIHLNTGTETLEESVNRVLDYLKQQGII